MLFTVCLWQLFWNFLSKSKKVLRLYHDSQATAGWIPIGPVEQKWKWGQWDEDVKLSSLGTNSSP